MPPWSGRRAREPRAREEADRDRAVLLAAKGDDANASSQRVDLIHKRLN